MKSIDTAGIAKALVPRIDMSGLFPAQSTSWFSKLLPNVPKFELPSVAAKRPTETVNLATLPPTSALPVFHHQSRIDLDTGATGCVAGGHPGSRREARAHEMRGRQIELLSELLTGARVIVAPGDEALTLSKQALDATKSSKRAGWIVA